VDAVLREPSSAANSLLIREITGNFRKKGSFGTPVERIAGADSVSYPLFPAKINREFFSG
jgi:hypothetical protein